MKIRNLRHYSNTQILQKEEVVYITWPSIILNTFNFLASFFSIIALACSNINIKHFIKISVFDSHNKVILSILYFFSLLLFCFLSFCPFINPITSKVTASIPYMFIIHQIFLLVRNCSRHIIWLKNPQL